MIDVEQKTPHLSDIFKSGKDTKIVFPGKPEVDVWVERPSPDQHEECMKRARSDRARRYHELTAEDSDEHLALLQEVGGLDKEELVQALLDRETRTLERQALHDVLYSEDFGSDWGKEGEKWSAVLDGLQERIEEIRVHNDELKAANAESGFIDIEKDEEIIRLSAVQSSFEAEVGARKAELVGDRKIEIALDPIDKLRKSLLEQRVSLECDLAWYATFKYEQLFRAVRYQHDHSTLYFKNTSQIQGLPRPVQDQLFEALSEVDVNVEDLKNLSTPLPS